MVADHRAIFYAPIFLYKSYFSIQTILWRHFLPSLGLLVFLLLFLLSIGLFFVFLIWKDPTLLGLEKVRVDLQIR